MAIWTALLLMSCATDAEMEAYYHEQCLVDQVTFENIEPGSPAYLHCIDLHRSGLGDDPFGGEGLGQFAD
ncbi:MAG: hypothetical protein ACO3MW_06115 [Rhodospirillales bacterium]|jgi:hypothetical protein